MSRQVVSNIIKRLEEMPALMRRMGDGLTAEELKWKPSLEEFSFVEQVCHLRDLEREGYGVRVEKLMTQPLPLLPDFDGARMARERDYKAQNYDAALGEFVEARQRNVDVVRNLSSDELSRRGTLEGVGDVTLEDLLTLMHEHDSGHLNEMRAMRERLLSQKDVAR